MADGFTNAIIGGAETLIRSAIKSVNYVLGIAGWRISKEGSAEFNDVTVRGTIIADNGDIIIDQNGITVNGNNRQWIIDSQVGFLSRRVPDDGTLAQIFDAGVFFRPITPSPINGAVINSKAVIFANLLTQGSDEAPFLQMISPLWTGKPGSAGLIFVGQSALSVVDNSFTVITGSHITLDTPQATVNGRIEVGTIDLGAGLFGYGTNGLVSFNTTTETIVCTSAFIYDFKKGHLYRVVMKSPGSVGTAPNRVVNRLRKGTTIAGAQIDTSGSQFSTTSAGNMNWDTVFVCDPANDVTTALVWTGASGTAFVVNYAAPVRMEIYDIGLAADTGITGIPILT